MTATSHAVIAVLIAGKVSNPIVAATFSFASHFVGDLVPHWDTGTGWRKKSKTKLFFESSFDLLISLVVSYIIFSSVLGKTDYFNLYLSVFFSQFPDYLAAPYLIFKSKFPLFVWVENFQSNFHVRLDKPWGIVTQIIAIVLFYLLLYKVF